MVKLFVRVALCAGLVLSGGFVRAEGDLAPSGDPVVKTTKTEKGRESKIRVFLPTEDAKLFFDQTPTKASGKERAFRSPALEDGKRYSYKVVAMWVENGREVTHETKIIFHAGEDIAVDFRR